MADADVDSRSAASRKRRRAVRLTNSALQQLNSDLSRRCEAGQRLTRELRSELMGVSLATADKVLNRQGVDRSTLALVFGNLDIDWHESLCEFVPLEAAAPMLEATLPPSEEPRRRITSLWVAVPVLAVLTITFTCFGSTPEKSPTSNGTVEAGFLIQKAIDHYSAGDYAAARKELDDAAGISRSKQNGGQLATALRLAGDIESAHGNHVEARRLYELALVQRQILKDKVSEPAILEAIGVCKLELGDLKGARRDLMWALQHFRRVNDHAGVAMASRDLASVSLAEGDLPQADRWITSARDALGSRHEPDLRMDISARKSLILSRRGKALEARKILIQCREHWAKRGHARWIAVTELQLGMVELAAGNAQSARKWLQESKAGFQAVGDMAGLRKCDGYLARL